MDNIDKLTYYILKYSSNEKYKNLLTDLTYIKHIIKFKFLFDEDYNNKQILNAYKLIEENEILSIDDKELILTYIKNNYK